MGWNWCSMTDFELLKQFRAGSNDALGELISRHTDWVYSAALRQMRDVHLAEDVTQAVFIVLAKKAHSLGEKQLVGPWLFGVLRFVASHARRSEMRRRTHEQKAA